MLNKFHFLLLVSCFAVAQVAGQGEACQPTSVSQPAVSADLILSWQIHPSEDCSISHFVVLIYINGEETEYTTNETSMDVRFLPTCVVARISIIPISTENVEGLWHLLFLNMPVPPEANLALSYLQIRQQSEDRFALSWDMDEEWRHCAKQFRVITYNEHQNDAEDIYVDTTSVVLDNILPCEEYIFGVTAVYVLEKQGPISSIRYTTPSRKIAPPALQRVTLSTTNVVLEWQLQSYDQNSCQVSSIQVNASPYFQAAFPVRDSPNRPIVTTTITGLQADIIYFLNVTVVNTAGPSAPFLAAVQTLANN